MKSSLKKDSPYFFKNGSLEKVSKEGIISRIILLGMKEKDERNFIIITLLTGEDIKIKNFYPWLKGRGWPEKGKTLSHFYLERRVLFSQDKKSIYLK
ncbi:hypothetical protein CVV26_02310 [Candidatus Kuenenbacteria bacterium HGW-Kuenenbacteria-1]|uniref:Uncharacterized protein n=1 Tax=Candidatus Kuenenbacteria bacterium HGW-Kuenenbacteria-1 TaxID=2013812 RepID=A0A2N1UNA4_9BACT|nr:MAG: hypothetical protein CVV26_02310 [Candidatus Kuenenbacteria bacterium HGW-Kuenenbacteria-1]